MVPMECKCSFYGEFRIRSTEHVRSIIGFGKISGKHFTMLMSNYGLVKCGIKIDTELQ